MVFILSRYKKQDVNVVLYLYQFVMITMIPN
jgi:hypothetical protein